MPKTRECDYCGDDIEPGTGMMLVRKTGQTVDYCSAKCEKNADLGREARDLNWTDAGRESDRQETAAAEREQEAAAEEAAADAAEEDADADDAEEESDATPDLEAAEAEADDESSEEDEDQAEEAQA